MPDQASPTSPEQIEAAAYSDPDAIPLSPDDLQRMRRSPRAKIIRRALGLTQEEFAARYRIPVGTLRDWEQGRTEPDQTARAYLMAIARDAEGLRRALASDGDGTLKTGSAAEQKQLLRTDIEGEVFVHRQLWRVVLRQVDRAAATPKGAFLDDLVTMVFAFHTLEAYLNFVGERLDPHLWKNERDFFRREPYRGFEGKVRKVLELTDLPEPSRSSRPYGTVWLLKELRDLIVHAKPEKFSRTVYHGGLAEEEPNLTHLPFGGLVTAENARIAVHDVEAFIEGIHSAAAATLVPADVWFGDKALSGPLQRGTGSTAVAT